MLRKSFLFITLCLILSLLLTACGGVQAQDKTFTIGVVNYSPPLNQSIEGFKAGMADLGYVEGENVTYIYNGLVDPNPQAINQEIESLLAQKVDLLFTNGNPTTLAAKQAVAGTDIPVVFGPTMGPVETGMVESIRQPGGNLTGIHVTPAIPKAMEWSIKMIPGTTKVYVPYDPEEIVAVASLTLLTEAAPTLGVELIPDEVLTLEELNAAIETLPQDAIIFMVPTVINVSDFVEVATEHGIAIGSYMPNHLEQGAVVTYTTDFFVIGKQAARLADQIFKGTKPADLPVETAETFLNINLQSATALGLDIPDTVLRQADTVIR